MKYAFGKTVRMTQQQAIERGAGDLEGGLRHPHRDPPGGNAMDPRAVLEIVVRPKVAKIAGEVRSGWSGCSRRVRRMPT